MIETRAYFGRAVFGPIFAEFALRLWIYLASLPEPEDTALFFCARGGLRLKLVYERFLAASALESPAPASAFMVSRIVAVRPALLADADSAYLQIGYELSKARLLDVVRAVSGAAPPDESAPSGWLDPYSSPRLKALLASDAGRPVRRRIETQVELFLRHCRELAAGRTRVVLCDTGLFGSTLQLLMDGVPEYAWSAAMIGRANYKRLPAPHFARTVGLSFEADQYCPWRARTSALRFWHLMESILEPSLPSVTHFADVGGSPRSNLETEHWRDRIAPEADSLLGGALEYIDQLRPGCATKVLAEAEVAWGALRRAIVAPRADHGRILNVGRRSDDFGRMNSGFTARRWRGPIAALRGKTIWREGEIALGAPLMRAPLLLAIEAGYGLRWFRRRFAAEPSTPRPAPRPVGSAPDASATAGVR